MLDSFVCLYYCLDCWWRGSDGDIDVGVDGDVDGDVDGGVNGDGGRWWC